MFRKTLFAIGAGMMLLLPASAAVAGGSSTDFSYQGTLKDNGLAVSATADFVFRLYDAPAGGALLGTNSLNNVTVQGGVFNVVLDYGTNPFDTGNTELWLEIDARTPAGGGGFTTLSPRQELTPAPRSLSTRGIDVNAIGSIRTGALGVDLPHIVDLEGRDVFLRLIGETAGGGSSTSIAMNEVELGGGDFVSSWGFWRSSGVNGALRLSNGTTPAPESNPTVMSFHSTGSVGIGTDTSNSRLTVSSPFPEAGDIEFMTSNGGDIRFDGGDDGVFFIENSGGDAGATILGRTGGTRLVRINNDGSVGIGTDSPIARLHVADGSMWLGGDDVGGLPAAAGKGLRFFNDSINDFRKILAYDYGANAFANMKVEGANMRLEFDKFSFQDFGGGFGINTETPGFTLEVNGSAGKPGGGSWSVSSDRRLKKDVADLAGVLDTLLDLRGVTFEYKDPAAINELPGRRVGFIAQEVEKVIPDWVNERTDGYKALTIRGFEAMAVEAMRELKQENDDLKARVEMLEAMVEDILLSK